MSASMAAHQTPTVSGDFANATRVSTSCGVSAEMQRWELFLFSPCFPLISNTHQTDLRNEEQGGGSRGEGGRCSTRADCTTMDINMVCMWVAMTAPSPPTNIFLKRQGSSLLSDLNLRSYYMRTSTSVKIAIYGFTSIICLLRKTKLGWRDGLPMPPGHEVEHEGAWMSGAYFLFGIFFIKLGHISCLSWMPQTILWFFLWRKHYALG